MLEIFVGGEMNILVCVKQVPGSNEVQVDPNTGVLIRTQDNNKLNPYDLFSIEFALRLKELVGGSVTTLTMGPPQAKQTIEETISMGCDTGCVVSDRAFAGADVLATSYTLSQAIRKLGAFDLILCGKQTTDGDTAQVGAELAEHLGIPHLSNVSSLVSCSAKAIVVDAFQENLVITEQLPYPVLLCLDSEINTPRLPSYKRMKEHKAEVKILTLTDFEDKDISHYGLRGSPTQVQKIFPPEKNTDRELHEGSGRQLSDELAALLVAKKFV